MWQNYFMFYILLYLIILQLPVPAAPRSPALVYGRSLIVIAGSNPTGGMVVCDLRVLCAASERSLLRADHSSRGVIPSVCLSMIVKP